MNHVERARRYLAKLPTAVSGSGGHNATLAAACRLVEFGLPEEVAFALLSEWNQTHCLPPWHESELRHKLADAFKRTSPRGTFAQRSGGNGGPVQRIVPSPVAVASPKHAARCVALGGGSVPRPWIPRTLGPGHAADVQALATMRRVRSDAVAMASRAGLVRFGLWRGAPAWFVLDETGRVAQARRMDGQPFASKVKAWTLRGSCPRWPVGAMGARGARVVAVVEGGPDLLAAFHFILERGRDDVAPVAMLGAGMRIDEDALPIFSGKRVRIFTHADDAGAKAAARWAGQLEAAGAQVDAFAFVGLKASDGTPVKDLNDAARLSPGDAEKHPFLKDIFP